MMQSTRLLNNGLLNNEPEGQAKTTDVSHEQQLQSLREFKQEEQLRLEMHDFNETDVRSLLAAFHGNGADLLHDYRTNRPMLKLMLALPDFNQSELQTLLEAFHGKVEDLKRAFHADKAMVNLMLVPKGFHVGELQVLLAAFQGDHAELKRRYFTNRSSLKAILDEKVPVEIPEDRFELPGFTENQAQILLVLSDGNRDSLKDVYLRRPAVLHDMLSTNQTLKFALEGGERF